MNALTEFLSSPVAERIGLTLVHSVWQLALVAVIVFLVLRSLRRHSPNVRYLVSCAALLLMVVTPVLTFVFLRVDEQGHSRLAELREPAPLAVPATRLRVNVNSLVEATEIDGKGIEGTDKMLVPPRSAAGENILPEATVAPFSGPSVSETPLVEKHTTLVGAEAPAEVPTELPAPVALKKPTANFSLLESVSESLVPWSPWITFVWFIGFVIITVRNVGGWQATRRLRCLSSDVDHPRAHALLRKLSEKLGIRRQVRMRECELVQTPIVFGWLKPIVLTPIGLLTQLTNDQLEALLAHELGHVSSS